jgi:hypothetical protein
MRKLDLTLNSKSKLEQKRTKLGGIMLPGCKICKAIIIIVIVIIVIATIIIKACCWHKTDV